MKILKTITFWIISLICILILSVGCMYLIGAIQGNLFLPKEYIIWIFKYPFSNLVFIYEFYIIFGFVYFFNKDFKTFILWVITLKKSFIKRNKISFLFTFVALNILLIYTIFFNVTVITNNKIIDYTFLSPLGKEYLYKDIVKIDAGVYGNKRRSPFTHYLKGDFYYIIQFNNGTKIHLTDVGGNKNNGDSRFIIEKLDSEFVSMGISKVSSMDNFQYCTQHLDKIYTDKIQNILLNIK